MLRHEWFNVGDVCRHCNGEGVYDYGDSVVTCRECNNGRTWRRVEALSDAGGSQVTP